MLGVTAEDVARCDVLQPPAPNCGIHTYVYVKLSTTSYCGGLQAAEAPVAQPVGTLDYCRTAVVALTESRDEHVLVVLTRHRQQGSRHEAE
jgi:hypothetical protein